MNLWPIEFEENNNTAAKQFLEEQAKLLPTLTGDLVYAEVKQITEMETPTGSIDNDFIFRFDLRGKFLQNYRFTVFTFSHDITLYPVKFLLDEKIGAELGIEKSIRHYIAKVDTPEILEKLVESIFRSERLKTIVGSIMRLSK